MKIGIIGAGNIGGNLGAIWAKFGHEIVFGVRNPQSEKTQTLLSQITGNVTAKTLKEAAEFGEIVVIAIHWGVLPEVLAEIGSLLAGKTVIDCTNRMIQPAPGSAATAAEEIARLAPGAKVFKAFNTLGANNLKNLKFGDRAASTFICGDDVESKKIVTQLAQEIGFDVVDVGGLNTAHLIESLAKLWVQISRNSTGREVAFTLLRR